MPILAEIYHSSAQCTLASNTIPSSNCLDIKNAPE